ncbi:MBL fold metallo-hydrolase [Algoriphagus confluentis]|uniref:MBL fold metallo-hydrolase n=2 Tax=Algoriphagus confluentis TaxID=1697556 RepID=A0ABQ6PKR6_9BACT|nr:MBL fold metallo-hydrolase [Algoriphagus confluentis]
MNRRKFMGSLGVAIPAVALYHYLDIKPEPTLSFISNPKLPYDKLPSGWKGTPLRSDGTFQNLFHPFEASLTEVLKWKLKGNPQAEEKKKDKRRLEIQKISRFKPNGKDQIIWLGHASYLIHIGGVTLLTDPVWLENWILKRYSDLPINPETLEGIDYILISHDHRDHCDEATLKLLGKTLPQAQILTGLRMTDLLQPWMPKNKIQEAGWFQSYDLKESLRITFVPSRHWSRRGLLDTNQRLWGGYFMESGDKSLYFMSDSGYGPHFKLIGDTLGAPEYAMMGVGAFKPEWFMHPVHTSPMDAVKAYQEMGGKNFIPMHFGTFDLSDELLLEPLDWLTEHANEVSGNLIYPVLGKNLI